MAKIYSDKLMKKELSVTWKKRTWSKYEQYGLIVEYWPDARIIHELGHVKKTNDNRWRWTALDSKDSRFALPKDVDKVQGVASTLEEAQAKLEAIWNIQND